MNTIDILGTIKKFKENSINDIPFFGTILTNPANKCYIDRLNECKHVDTVKPYKIQYNQYLLERDHDKIVFNDTKLWKYSSGPQSGIGWSEYEKMCLYFGWARIEKGGPLFYFMEDKVLNGFKDIHMLIEPYSKVVMTKVEKSIFNPPH